MWIGDIMKLYIISKRKVGKLVSILNLIFWIINFVFVELSVNMLIKIINAGNSVWFDKVAKQELTNDPFFINRADTIMEMVIFVLVIVILFSVVTIVLFRNIQLKNMLSQMGMYRVLGYSKQKLFGVCMLEPIADMIIAFPVSIVLSIIIWGSLSNVEVITFLLKLMNNTMSMDIVAFCVCAVFVIVITAIHTKIFMERSLKKGIRYMLGKGVV